MTSLVLWLLFILLLGAVAWLLKRARRVQSKGMTWLTVGVVGPVFVGLGAVALLHLTEGKGAIEETTPWLTLVALAASAVYVRYQSRLRQRDRPEAATAERHASPSSPPANSPMPAVAKVAPTVFISYRRGDSADVTGRIHDRLVGHFGQPHVFKDVDSIALGLDFRQQIADAVGQCEVVLAIIGRLWRSGDTVSATDRLADPRDFVRIEIESAIERHIPVIPVLVQGAAMPAPESLPPSLQDLGYRHAIQVRTDPDFHTDIDRLIKGIESHVKPGG